MFFFWGTEWIVTGYLPYDIHVWNVSPLNKKSKCYSSQFSCCFPNELRFLEGFQVPPVCPSSKSSLKNEVDYVAVVEFYSPCATLSTTNLTLTWDRTWTSAMTEKPSCLSHGTAFHIKINLICSSESIPYRAVNTFCLGYKNQSVNVV